MPISAAELENIASSTLSYYTDLGNKKAPIWQHLEERPLLMSLRSTQETVPGGDDFRISMPIIAETTTAFVGFSGDDTITYQNPTNTKRVTYTMKELHAGLKVTESALKMNGISVTDDTKGNTGGMSRQEKIQLQNLLKNKMKDLTEGSLQSLEDMLHGDAAESGDIPPGLRTLIHDNPTAVGAVTGGLDITLVANAPFRNRSAVNNGVGGNNNGGTDDRIDVTGGTLITEFIQTEMRQLTRFGGKPNLALCGSDFLDQLIKELLAKGNYTDRGWSSSGSTDIKVADIHYGNMTFKYDPGMDTYNTRDPGNYDYTKRCYLIDTRHLKLCVQDGYDFKARNPTRNPDEYAIYRALNWTGCLTLDKPNSCGVYEFK